MTTIVTIWDGIEFLNVSKKEAKSLVKADKAQIMDGIIDGLSMKYRHEFTGYDKPVSEATADADILAAAATPLPMPKVELPMPPTEKAAAVQGMNTSAKMKDWRTYKTIVAKGLKKPANRVTKADVEKYLDGEHGDT